ncbi:MAG: hypothetical protein ACFFDJ_08440 [Candidatus Odinarchaeota archaeon]
MSVTYSSPTDASSTPGIAPFWRNDVRQIIFHVIGRKLQVRLRQSFKRTYNAPKNHLKHTIMDKTTVTDKKGQHL